MASGEVFEFGYRHGRQMSHFLVDVTAHGRENLAHALAVAFSDIISREKRATHFAADGSRRLTLFDGPPPLDKKLAAEAFAAPLTCQQAVDFVWDWLERAQYEEDEHDGSSRKGWRVFNERFGIVGGCWEAFVAIQPVWVYIPK